MKEERIKMVKAMEYIARQCNSEDVFDYWLSLGVADGDIEYGDLSVWKEECFAEDISVSDMAYYTDDLVFSDLMYRFLKLMSMANKDGGLYCDKVVSRKPKIDKEIKKR